MCSINYNDIVSCYSGSKYSQINFVLKLKKKYEDPIDELSNDCDVERRIDNILNLDFMESCVEGSSYVSDQIKLWKKIILCLIMD